MSNSIDLNVNLTKVQFVMALIAHAVAILAAAMTMALWVGRVLIAQEFQTQLDIFHSHAVPAIEQMVESISHATQAGSTQLETTKQVEETARQLRQLSREMLDVVGGKSNGLTPSASAG